MEDGMMDAIGQLAHYGPWGFAVAIVALLRKEIGAVLASPRGDRAVEILMREMTNQQGAMNETFAENMRMFHVTNAELGIIKLAMTDLVSIQRQVLTEMVRGK